ncbi:MAG TPA: hypothetical protein PLK37_08495, partial [Terricaulis sp.]|nr:hypothetical protein [Terricaulis sp.]
MELLQPIAACFALLAVAAVAFARPERVLACAGAVGAFAALGLGVIWRAAPGGELSHWMAGLLAVLAGAVLFALAALLRHMLNALGARALR